MLEDVFGDAAVADAPDHARVFSLVREDLASGQLGGQGEQSSGEVAAGEYEGGLLCVEALDLVLQFLVEDGSYPHYTHCLLYKFRIVLLLYLFFTVNFW